MEFNFKEYLVNVSLRCFNFSIYGKIFKSFTLIKVRYCTLNIFHICLGCNFREWHANVNLTKNNILGTFLKNWNISISFIILNCILVSPREEINAWPRVIYDMGRFINNLFISTTIFIILWEFLMFYQIFLLSPVKRNLIISNKLVYTSCLTSCRMT